MSFSTSSMKRLKTQLWLHPATKQASPWATTQPWECTTAWSQRSKSCHFAVKIASASENKLAFMTLPYTKMIWRRSWATGKTGEWRQISQTCTKSKRRMRTSKSASIGTSRTLSKVSAPKTSSWTTVSSSSVTKNWSRLMPKWRKTTKLSSKRPERS